MRQYPGCEFIDQIETLCQQRALQAYNLDPNEWGVNVQPYSGSPANMAVYTALLRPHARIMGLDVSSGGHLTHGLYTPGEGGGGPAHTTREHVAATSKYFESLPYRVNNRTGLIDMKALAAQAEMFRPELLICGHSAYPRELEYAKYRKIADSCGALLLCDMAHISGLIAAGEAESPFKHVDLVSTTTHKTLRGPRAGMIFYRKDARNLGPRIDAAVWPALQGGAHMHQIAAIATQLKEVMSEDFRLYTRQVKANAKALAAHMQIQYGYVIPTGGTDNHIVLWDLKAQGITGAEMQFLCEQCGITLSKCALPSDKDVNAPTGVRIGTPALTTRGFGVEEFQAVGDILHRAMQLAQSIQAQAQNAAVSAGKVSKKQQKATNTFEEFKSIVLFNTEVQALAAEVSKHMTRFPMPGADVQPLMAGVATTTATTMKTTTSTSSVVTDNDDALPTTAANQQLDEERVIHGSQ